MKFCHTQNNTYRRPKSIPRKSNTVCILINFLALLLCHLPASSAPVLVFLIFLPSVLPPYHDVTNVTDEPGRIAPSSPPCSHFASATLALPGGIRAWESLTSHRVPHMPWRIRWHVQSRLLISVTGRHISGFSVNCHTMKVTLSSAPLWRDQLWRQSQPWNQFGPAVMNFTLTRGGWGAHTEGYIHIRPGAAGM